MKRMMLATPAMLPVLMIGMWFVISTVLSLASGWYRLMQRFPDRRDRSVATFRSVSGTLNMVGMRGVLRVSVCPSGLRFGMFRLFGVFCRDFFVPWDQLTISATTTLGIKRIQIGFGTGSKGQSAKLTLAPEVAARIADAARSVAPPLLFPPAERDDEFARRMFWQWLVSTCVAAAFLTLLPRIVFALQTNANGKDVLIPWYVTVIFPALVFGIATFFNFLRYRQRR